MKRVYGFSLAALALLVTVLVIFSWRKTILIAIDERPMTVTVFAWTVADALRAAKIPLGAADRVEPSIDTRLTAGQTIQLDRAAAVQINAGGPIINLTTTARRPLEFLRQAGIELLPGDVLLANGLPVEAEGLLPQAEAYSVQILYPEAITFSTEPGGVISSTAATLGQALWQAGTRLRVADRLSPSFNTPLAGANQVHLAVSRPVTLLTAQDTQSRYTAAENVGEALAEAGLAPQGLDYTIPAANEALPADGVIRLVRLREEVLIEQAALPFGSELQPVEDLELDQRQLVLPGTYGIQASRVRVRYEDGQEISRVIESQWQAQEPVDEIIGYGTKIVMHTLETPDGTISYYRALPFWATAYAPKYVGGSTRTASGKPLQKGLVGVDTAYIPFGTLMYIPGYGFAEAADTGHIVGRWIDLGYSDEDFEGWHQWVTVYFLWPPGYVAPIIPPPSRY